METNGLPLVQACRKVQKLGRTRAVRELGWNSSGIFTGRIRRGWRRSGRWRIEGAELSSSSLTDAVAGRGAVSAKLGGVEFCQAFFGI